MSLGREGIVFGDGHSLPDADVLGSFDFSANVLGRTVEGGSNTVAAIPGYPEAVVRIQASFLSSQQYSTIALQGLEHFDRMVQAGLNLPAQRLVEGRVYPNYPPMLCSITERVDGQRLTDNQTDARYAEWLIGSHATYLIGVYKDRLDKYLWDKGRPWEHTITANGQVVMHDVGLNFDHMPNHPDYPNSSFYYSAPLLLEWAKEAKIKIPDSLRYLLNREPIYSRAARFTLRAISNLIDRHTKSEQKVI